MSFSLSRQLPLPWNGEERSAKSEERFVERLASQAFASGRAEVCAGRNLVFRCRKISEVRD